MQFLCELSQIPCPGSHEFEFAGQRIFVVRKAQTVRAFVNSCPHTGAPLNWQPHRFLDAENEHIQCDLHMAVFDFESGRCIAGPCAGDHLNKIVIKVRQEQVFVVEELV